MRKAGILMPIASLPSPNGIGDFGPSCDEFIKLIKQAGFKVWQILPLNPLGYGNSPYQPYSSKAMDELYISLEELVRDGLLKKVKKFQPQSTKIDYDEVRKFKQSALQEAFLNFKETEEFKQFCNQEWVRNYAVFLTLKKKNDMNCWNEWPLDDKNWINDKKLDLTTYEQNIRYEMFNQYILLKQWEKLRKLANDEGIEIIGDIPIYVGIDSDDVWSNQESFLLDKDGRPTYIAGVPPDFFSEDGQRWGNPLYDWDYLQKEGFKFWLDRLAYSAELFDVIRIDHFRAFDTYWKIEASELTAKKGEWIEAPGYELFETIYKTYPNIKIVAEDLGDLRPEVLELRDHFNLTGMRIVQHSFDSAGMKTDRENLIAYTGTHDNETIRSWYSRLSQKEKKRVQLFFRENKFNFETVADNMIQYTLSSKAKYAIIPMVDLLNKTDRCRINFPGTVGNPNWQWKMKNFDDFKEVLPKVKQMIKQSNR